MYLHQYIHICIYLSKGKQMTAADTQVRYKSIYTPACAWVLLVVVFSLGAQTIDTTCILYTYYTLYVL